jgi:hypothetical protein
MLADARSPNGRDALFWLGLPMGTKVWPRRFRVDPNVVSQQQRRICYVKDARRVSLNPCFR